MKRTLIPLFTIVSLLLGCESTHRGSSDQARIQGVWLAQTESQNGQKRNVTYQYVFRGDSLVFIDESGKEMKYSFKLDTASKLKLLVIQPAESIASSTPVSVAYELAGDSLTLVVAAPGSRPTEISDKNNQELIVCKRKRL